MQAAENRSAFDAPNGLNEASDRCVLAVPCATKRCRTLRLQHHARHQEHPGRRHHRHGRDCTGAERSRRAHGPRRPVALLIRAKRNGASSCVASRFYRRKFGGQSPHRSKASSSRAVARLRPSIRPTCPQHCPNLQTIRGLIEICSLALMVHRVSLMGYSRAQRLEGDDGRYCR
jgi:hypothetical protein